MAELFGKDSGLYMPAIYIKDLKEIINAVESKEAVEDKEIKADGYIGAYSEDDFGNIAGTFAETEEECRAKTAIAISKQHNPSFPWPTPDNITDGKPYTLRIRPIKFLFLDTVKESGEKVE